MAPELHRYLSSHVIETLDSGELLANKVSKFNDPFEFAYRVPEEISKSDARKFWKRLKTTDSTYEAAKRKHPEIKNKKDYKKFVLKNLEKLAEEYRANFKEISKYNPLEWSADADNDYRIICFSAKSVESEDELLLWSHYASSHAGARLIFSFDELQTGVLIRKVKYSTNRVVLYSPDLRVTQKLQEGAEDLIVTKSSAWRYENEHRMILSPRVCNERHSDDLSIRSFFKFDKRSLIGLDLGLRFPETEIGIVKSAIEAGGYNCILRVAEFHDSEYKIVYRPI